MKRNLYFSFGEHVLTKSVRFKRTRMLNAVSVTKSTPATVKRNAMIVERNAFNEEKLFN